MGTVQKRKRKLAAETEWGRGEKGDKVSHQRATTHREKDRLKQFWLGVYERRGTHAQTMRKQQRMKKSCCKGLGESS